MIFPVWDHANYWEISQASETPNGLKAEINKYLWKTYGADTTVPWTYWSLARDEHGRFKDGRKEMDDFPAFFANLLRAEFVSSYNFLEHPATLSLVKRSCAVGMSYVNCLFVWGNLKKESRFRPTSLIFLIQKDPDWDGMDVESSPTQHDRTLWRTIVAS